jgi:hypothetical protein
MKRVLAALVLTSACSSAPPPVAPAPIPSACAFGSLTQPGRVFAFAAAGAPVTPATRCSRFVLYDSGAFELQYGTGAVYPGSYQQSGATLDLQWVGQSVAGAWHADATLVADTLSVHYNAIMQLTDFEDAVYTRAS